jgi:hypothetical protein
MSLPETATTDSLNVTTKLLDTATPVAPSAGENVETVGALASAVELLVSE